MPRSSLAHITSLDGLRGLASLNVCLNHFVAAFLPAALGGLYPGSFSANDGRFPIPAALNWPFSNLLYSGHFAVLVFFVLSGYVLALPFHHGDPERLRQRILSRWLRLSLPIAISVSLAYAIYILGMFHNKAAAAAAQSPWLDGYYQQGITVLSAIRQALYGTLLLGDAQLNGPLWTLRYELLGSLLLLAVLIIAPPKRTLMLSLATMMALLPTASRPETLYLWIFFAGAALPAIQLPRRILPTLAILGLTLGSYDERFGLFQHLPYIFFGKKDFYNAIGAIALIAAIAQGYGSSLLNRRPFQWLGQISFGLYLVHFPLLCSLGCWVYLFHSGSAIWLVAVLIIYLGASLVVAHGFSRSVDRWSISTAHALTRMSASRATDTATVGS
jgi:peptidoglycan/LPS O-acetylase OafA/YrhL